MFLTTRGLALWMYSKIHMTVDCGRDNGLVRVRLSWGLRGFDQAVALAGVLAVIELRLVVLRPLLLLLRP